MNYGFIPSSVLQPSTELRPSQVGFTFCCARLILERTHGSEPVLTHTHTAKQVDHLGPPASSGLHWKNMNY